MILLFQNIPVCYQLLLSYVSAVVKRIGGTLNCYIRSGILIAVIILIVVLLIVYIIKTIREAPSEFFTSFLLIENQDFRIPFHKVGVEKYPFGHIARHEVQVDGKTACIGQYARNILSMYYFLILSVHSRISYRIIVCFQPDTSVAYQLVQIILLSVEKSSSV